MYAEKYRPRKLSEVIGQPKALRELLSWFNTWPSQKKVVMLHGKSGVGKTCTIYALKEEFDLDLIELNTSDNRNFENVMRIVGNASNSHSLEGKRRLILLDEVDNISGREDRGGVRAINRIIDTTKVPIVLIVNEYWQISQSLREKCKLIAYQPLRSPSIFKVLRRIRDSENLKVRDSELLELAKNAGGDLRAAFNDLESFYPEMRNLRDERTSIFSALVPLFKNQSAKVREKFFNVEKTPEEVLWWITENLPKVYEPQDLRKAFYYASRSDVFLGRVRRRQYYKFWSYANDLMTSGISVSREGEFHFARFSSPTYFILLARSRAKREKAKKILKKISEKCHCSTKVATQYLDLIESLERVPGKCAKLCLYFGLEEDEIRHILKNPTPTLKSFRELQISKKKPEIQIERKSKKAMKRKEEKKERGRQKSLFEF